MRPCDLMAVDIALFSRKILNTAEFDELSVLEQQECEDALAAAKAAAAAYTGLDIEATEQEDLAYAVKVLAAEMIDNHQITTQYTGKNPVAMQIMDLHKPAAQRRGVIGCRTTFLPLCGIKSRS